MTTPQHPSESPQPSETRRAILCGGRQFTFVVFVDGLVTVLDDKGIMVAGWPSTASLTAFTVRTSDEDDLCLELARMGLRA